MTSIEGNSLSSNTNGPGSVVWWNVTPTGKWVTDFNVGRRYARTIWEVCGSGRKFALEFQQVILGMLTKAKTYRDAGYSGIEAGFLLTIGELSGGVIHVDALLQNYEALAPRNSPATVRRSKKVQV